MLHKGVLFFLRYGETNHVFVIAVLHLAGCVEVAGVKLVPSSHTSSCPLFTGFASHTG